MGNEYSFSGANTTPSVRQSLLAFRFRTLSAYVSNPVGWGCFDDIWIMPLNKTIQTILAGL